MPFLRRDFDLSPTEFHELPVDVEQREIWVPVLRQRPTLVLGSAQDQGTIDRNRAAGAQIPITRRRSGGGAVLVSEADLVWFDLLIPSTDPLWENDVSRAFEWVGRTCAAALKVLGHDTAMHTGGPTNTEWSSSICFASVGAGELLIDGRKVVGISQRRTRDAARFQVAVLRQWNADLHANLLALDEPSRQRAIADLEMAAVGIDSSAASILDAVIAALPDEPPLP